MPFKTTIVASILLAVDLVAGHGAIVSATGDSGGSGMALGIDTSTPRDGTRRRPFQQDTTRFRGDAADTVGETLAGGDNDIESGTQAIMNEMGDDLPQVTPGGELSMTLHQVNTDGAGPYICMINDDGTGTSWEDITVTQNVPGRRGRDRDGRETDHPLVASIPEDQECTGTVAGQDNVCLVRCQNPAGAGPFGGVVPVQMVTGNNTGNGNGNNTGNGNGNNSGNRNGNNSGDGNNTGNGNNTGADGGDENGNGIENGSGNSDV